MKTIYLVLVSLIFILFYSCSANLYFQNSYFQKVDFEIDSTHQLAIPSFVSTNSEIANTTTSKFLELIGPSLMTFIDKPLKVDSILKNEKIYALPNELPDQLLADLSNKLNAKFIMVGYILNWSDADLGQDGIVKHKIDIYDMTSRQSIWSITNQVLISAPSEEEVDGIYFIGSTTSAYEKLVKKTLKKTG